MNEPTTSNFDVAVVIGRFQFPHRGHATLFRKALDVAENVIVIIGSAFHARSTSNPFTWEEVRDMILCEVGEEAGGRMIFFPTRDYYDNDRWVRTVERMTDPHTAGKSVALVGHLKDKTSYYLNNFPRWTQIELPQTIRIDATALRRAVLEADNVKVALMALNCVVSKDVAEFVRSWANLPFVDALREDLKAIDRIRDMWKGAPLPMQVNTADAVVTCQDRVLLIQRRKGPGAGLLALPGGMKEHDETFLECALRELREETRLGTLESILHQSLTRSELFDHPGRDERGCYVTRAFHFKLDASHDPEVLGSDDAKNAQWVHWDDIPALEMNFFQDHFHILDVFHPFEEKLLAATQN